MSGTFTITLMDVQMKCTYSYESGVASPKFSYTISGDNPGDYVLQYEPPQVVQGVARITLNIVDPRRGVFAAPQLKA